MKVVSKKDFLELPEGTVFCKGCQWVFYDMCVKNESTHNDYYYTPLYSMDCKGLDDYCDTLEDSLKNGTSYPMDLSIRRDGCFEEKDIFIIFEKEDLYDLINMLSKSLNNYKHYV
ncbi:MAG: hypothetical protein AABY22_00595 [Nanoarchaeota archaeon]